VLEDVVGENQIARLRFRIPIGHRPFRDFESVFRAGELSQPIRSFNPPHVKTLLRQARKESAIAEPDLEDTLSRLWKRFSCLGKQRLKKSDTFFVSFGISPGFSFIAFDGFILAVPVRDHVHAFRRFPLHTLQSALLAAENLVRTTEKDGLEASASAEIARIRRITI